MKENTNGHEPGTGDVSPMQNLPSPCPLCRSMLECPFAESPRDECLDLWPLGRPAKREFLIPPGRREEFRHEIERTPWLRKLVENWERGARVTDEQYLMLRRAYMEYDHSLSMLILANFMSKWTSRYEKDAMEYYGVPADADDLWASVHRELLKDAVYGAGDDLVDWDASSPVQSHFERLFCDFFRVGLYGLLKVSEVQMPEGDWAFQRSLEDEWKRALNYGNGYYGLTVLPTVSMPDTIRYQQLGRRDRVLSRSIVEHWVLQAREYPFAVQMHAPKLGEKIIEDRVMPMFEPLVGKCAASALTRSRARGEQHDREMLLTEFRNLLAEVLSQYRFMFRKAGTFHDGVGYVGLSASPERQEEVTRAPRALGVDMTSRDIMHINAAAYIGERLHAHLRTHHEVPWGREAQHESLEAKLGNGDGTTLGETIRGQDDIGDSVQYGAGTPRRFGLDGKRSSRKKRPVAAIIDGVKYRYVVEMAEKCNVTADQLRWWDRGGDLKALRFADVDPSRRGTEAEDWRVYPDTPEMRARIEAVARSKDLALAGLEEGEYSRKQAADSLGKSESTLKRWEQDDKSKPERRDGRVIYTAEEIRRLAGLGRGGKPSD